MVTLSSISSLSVRKCSRVRCRRDIKRRDTRKYLLATAGNKKIALWYLDPYTGDVSHDRIVCEARGSLVRDITALAFSEDRETLNCATSTGDFIGVDLRSKQVGKKPVNVQLSDVVNI